MGQLYDCRCQDCAAAFRAGWGGGLSFEELRCNACGDTVAVPRIHIENPGTQYPHREAWLAIQRSIKEHGFDKSAYERQVQAFLPPCDFCGGAYEFRAPARCPKCRSTRIEKGALVLRYD
jgi:hypothetical protein